MKFSIITIIYFSSFFFHFTFQSVTAQEMAQGKSVDDIVVHIDDEQQIKLTLLLDKTEVSTIQNKMLKAKLLEGGIREFYKYIWPPEMDINKLDDDVLEAELVKKSSDALLKTQESFMSLQRNQNFSYLTFLIHDMSQSHLSLNPVGIITLHRDFDQETKTFHTSIGISIFPYSSGGGIGLRSSKTLLNMVKHKLTEKELYWDCYEANIPSMKIAQRLGFQLYKIVDEAMGKAMYYKLDISKNGI